MTSQQTLAEAFRRLASALAGIENDVAGRERADGVRARLLAYIENVLTTVSGRTEKCPLHVGMPAHNCGPCRSERIGKQ